MEASPAATSVRSLLRNIETLLATGKPEAAEEACRRALRDYPDDLRLAASLGVAFLQQGRVVKAIQRLRRVCRKNPRYALAHEQLGNALCALGNAGEAVDAFERALATGTRPLDSASMRNLQKVVETNHGGNPGRWLVLGNAHARTGNSEGALQAYEKGLELDPDNGPLLLHAGHELRILGRQEESILSYEKCIELYPAVGEAYYSLANLKTYRFSDDLVAKMEEQLDSTTISDSARINFHFALGSAYEDREDYATAFEHFGKGNAGQRALLTFDTARTENFFARIRQVFSASLFDSHEAASSATDSPVPVFVVGLPRSGSTLVQQILSSHDDVEAAGELPDLDRVLRQLDVDHTSTVQFPEAFEQLSPSALSELGKQYLEATKHYRTDKPYFVDKMPHNFAFAGAIRLILPQARIINVRRHPVATCLACFKQLFYDGQPYTYDLDELADYYLQYDRVIEHWRSTIPDRILDLNYEALVEDQAGQTQRLLDHVGLAFDEKCLRFFDSGQAVATASSEQVRQPLYSHALESWRHYEPFLDRLIDKLGPVLAD